ncbi:4-galactosyl-N-acetylglucosaminide 3-alpha-L-fucosyltransferase 9 [Manduca sexta]|uniref:Fucosyltransferase n=1 Tax=Manduca sexta TaxID=7130 RepID=A0A922CGI3_MANSE|nr:4-galactosyl-N-acetylglucosaminide 3-alpha-L-fucosyltransferase 9 [Manduca sexta]KAG6445326.1 hypothetical protein O3G_MSEX003839 [Manduca sexta]
MANLTSCILKIIILVLMNLLIFVLYNCNYNELHVTNRYVMKLKTTGKQLKPEDHNRIVEEYFSKRKEWKTSMLGSILFQNQTHFTPSSKSYLILIWKHWHWLKNRHVYYFGEKPHDPFKECNVNNCQFTGKDELLDTADAVVVHLQRGLLPNVTQRNPRQRWIFLNDEAPPHVYSVSESPSIPQLANVFNWSMTYRTDADVPVPYGRTVALTKPKYLDPSYTNIAKLVPNWKIKTRHNLITVLMSHCSVSHRMKYLNTLKKYIDVQVHGRCSENQEIVCPGHYTSNCEKIDQYLFYLVLENAMCRQYMTEKLFYNAYEKGAIPIIRGPPLQDCQALLPPNSFIHVDNFLTPSDLAVEIINISKDDKKLLSYHLWRNHFKVVNEHGYFGTKSVHLCRLCEAMNYNDEREKIYDEDDIRLFFDEDILCSTQRNSTKLDSQLVINK